MDEAVAVHHIGMWVRDLARSGQFYRQIMGFEKKYGYRAPAEIIARIFGHHTDCLVEVYQRDDVRLELFCAEEPVTTPDAAGVSPAINHFSLKVADKLSFCEQAKKKGASVIKVDRGDHVICFLLDPDGIRIEIKEE